MKTILGDGRYEVLQSLGEGASARVYEVVDTRLSVTRALKRMALPPSEAARKRQEREARIMAKLNHPGIVTVFDAFLDDGQQCVVMELCQAGSLGDRVQLDGPIGDGQLLTWAAQLTEALSAAHAAGVLHRDLKPQNLLIGDDGNARIGDFGLSWTSEDPSVLTQTGALMGTVPYMAPALRKGDAHSEATDRYALAASLVHCATGRLPGDLDRVGAWDGVSADLQAVLQSHLDGLDMAPVGPTSDPGDPKRMRPASRLLLAGVLGAGCGAGLFFLLSGGLPERETHAQAPLDLVSEPPRCPDAVAGWVRQRTFGPREVIDAGFLDVNADGFDDAVFVSQLDEVLLVYPGGPEPSLDAAPLRLAGGRMAGLPVLLDINADGQPDLVVSEPDDAQLRIFLASPEGMGPDSHTLEQGPSLTDLASADVDGDGRPDLVGRGLDRAIYWRRALPEGGLGPHKTLWYGTQDRAIRLLWPWMRTQGPNGVALQRLSGDGSITERFMPPFGTWARVLPDGALSLSRGFVRVGRDGHPICTEGLMKEHRLGDWNGDGVWDAARAQTCAGCASNLHVDVGRAGG